MLNEKSDVYSFGVILLEMITGKPAIIKMEDGRKTPLVVWVGSHLKEGEFSQIIDSKLNGEYNIDSIQKALKIANACVANTATRRPTMCNVVTLLNECLELETSESKTSFTSVFDLEMASAPPLR